LCLFLDLGIATQCGRIATKRIVKARSDVQQAVACAEVARYAQIEEGVNGDSQRISMPAGRIVPRVKEGKYNKWWSSARHGEVEQ